MNNKLRIPQKNILLFSLILGVFLVYPNVATLMQGKTSYLKGVTGVFGHTVFFTFRYLYFTLLCYLLLTKNIKLEWKANLYQRASWSFWVSSLAFTIYLLISFIFGKVMDWFTVVLIFQFMSMWVISTLAGYSYTLHAHRLISETEIEQLKLDNLRSQYTALTNQVNPHFFFNSLNALSALVRKDDREQTLSYIQNLSSVFRYVLNTENKGTVTLDVELAFLDAFCFLLQTKFGSNLSFLIKIPTEKQYLNIPVLSLLPVLENIPKHNVIDSTMPMLVTITLNESDELVVSHRLQAKLETTQKDGGSGLNNLRNRFRLLLDCDIAIQDNDGYFTVKLPLH